MSYIFTSQLPANKIDQFVSCHPRCNVLQSSKWALIKKDWDHMYCGVYDGNEVVCASLVLIKHLPMGFTMFYLPKGPVLDFLDLSLVSYFFIELKKIAKKKRCLFIKFDPNIIKNQYKIGTYKDTISPISKEEIGNLKTCGCLHMGFSMNMRETIQPRFHATVVTNKNWEEELSKHTKRHMQTARKSFVEVTEFGIEKVVDFSLLISATEATKKIHLRDEKYFTHLLKVYGKDAHLFIASINCKELLQSRSDKLKKAKYELDTWKGDDIIKKEQLYKQVGLLQQEIKELQELLLQGLAKKAIAGTLAICFGDTCEMLYMGMDRSFRRYMPAYLSHYGPIKWATDNGYRICNMGGIEGSLDDGLTKFKSNFNPDIIEYVGEFELPVNTILYRVSHIAYRLYKTLTHLSF